MWNRSISLPRKKHGQQDAEGFQTESYEYEKGIPANFTDVTRNDEVLAAQKGYTVDQNVEIVACNYNGEPHLIDEETGDKLEIRRIYQKDKSMRLILSCERRTYGKL